jgi:hypothetical protein
LEDPRLKLQNADAIAAALLTFVLAGWNPCGDGYPMDSDAMKSPLMEEDPVTPAETGAPGSELPAAKEATTATPEPMPPSVTVADPAVADENEAVMEGESTREDSLHQDSERDHSYHGFDYRTKHGWNVTFSDDENFQLARLVRRDLPFSQSRNRVHVGHNHGWKILRLLRHDWFHVILRYPPGLSLLVLLSLWTCFVIFFAYLYVKVDSRDPNVDCGLGVVGDPINFGQAFSFSLETTTTGM